jgi:2-keto-4-pentenoate hydratase
VDRLEKIVDFIDQPGIYSDPSLDVVNFEPEITWTQALAVQLAVKRRRAQAGDRILGHQASFTSAALRATYPDSPRPMIGTLLASMARTHGDCVDLNGGTAAIENEIGVILKSDLAGPDVTPADVLRCVEGFVPCLEVAVLARGRKKLPSWPHMIACQKPYGGYVVVGTRITPPQKFDPRLEGCVVSVDGEARTGSTGFEAMGSPLHVVAAIAQGLHAIGEGLKAGQLVMTGSLAQPPVVTATTRVVQAEFQTLGSIAVRFAGSAA